MSEQKMTIGDKVMVGAVVAAGPALLVGSVVFPPVGLVLIGLAIYNVFTNPNPHWGNRRGSR